MDLKQEDPKETLSQEVQADLPTHHLPGLWQRGKLFTVCWIPDGSARPLGLSVPTSTLPLREAHVCMSPNQLEYAQVADPDPAR